MRTASNWNSSLSPRLLTTILVGLLASASTLAFPSQSFAVGDVNLAAADIIKGNGGGSLAANAALSGDGSTVIFGEQGHWGWAGTPRATVQVREWNGSSWVSKGSLPDANNREIGFWQDISDNGDVVSYSTHVLEKVFVADWSGSAWVQRPTITASQAGVSLGKHSLSGDGNVLVVGESGFDNGVEVNNGKVRTLDWDGSSWSERTAIIGAEGESLGNSRMDITADGATISFGGSLYSNADGAEVGRVRVATWDGASWAERPALTGSQASARASNPVLSDDGAVLGFSEAEWGVSGRIRTFDWRESSWIERPRVADGSHYWNDVDISASGTAISMSSYGNQKLRVYDWVGDSWVQRGSDAPTFWPGGGNHYGNEASMSSNGLMVATSQVYSDVNGSRSGRVDIYRSPGALRGVVFHSNGGSGAMSTQTSHTSAALTSSSFSKTGTTFRGWSTVADGSGTDYADGDTYDFSANVTLYAQWAPIAVTFDANSGSGSMADQMAAGGPTALTANAFTRTGYAFAGWNTDADGVGDAYADGSTFPFSSDDTLYAQWLKSSPSIEATHDIWIQGDGSNPDRGTSAHLVLKMGSSADGPVGKRVALLRFDYDPSYVWTSAALDLVVSLNQPGNSDRQYGTSFTSFNVNVYGANDADWAESSLNFVSARDTASDWKIVFTHPYSTPGATLLGSISVPANTRGSSAPTVGKSFSLSNPDLVTFLNNDSDGKVTFFITRTDGSNQSNLWFASSENTIYDGPRLTVPTVSFSSNGGSGSMADQTAAGSTALTSNSFTRQAYSFAGWNTAADGSGTAYADGASYDFAANLTLYAQWSAIPPPPPAESKSASAPLIDQDPATVTALGRAALLPEPDRPLKTAPVLIQRILQSSGSSQPAVAVALVGGEEVAVKATIRGSQAASYGVGKVTVDVGVAAKDGVVDSVGGVPSLKITKNSPAKVKGAGLQPNSTMQVFLPASNGSFIELPPVAVAADGSFDGSLPLRTSGRSIPMPIGKNSIQMVGVDDEGNETVLDIPVTIAQPLPAPEINRISGERPALTPGQGLALNAGSPETVTLKRSSAATSVEGKDWAVTVAGATIDSTGQTLAFTRDAPVAYSGEGFMPGTRADVWLFSDPTLVGTVDVAADGTFTANFAVDSNFVPTGDHTLQIQGVGEDGFVRAANLGVVVEDPVSTPLAPIDSDPIGWVPLMIIGTSVGGLLVLVGVTLAIRRGKRANGRLVPIS